MVLGVPAGETPSASNAEGVLGAPSAIASDSCCSQFRATCGKLVGRNGAETLLPEKVATSLPLLVDIHVQMEPKGLYPVHTYLCTQ